MQDSHFDKTCRGMVTDTTLQPRALLLSYLIKAADEMKAHILLELSPFDTI